MNCETCNDKGYLVIDFSIGKETKGDIERCDNCGMLSSDKEAEDKFVNEIDILNFY